MHCRPAYIMRFFSSRAQSKKAKLCLFALNQNGRVQSKKAKPCLFALNQNEISKHFAPLQTLFPPLKIAIFCRIVPYKISQTFCTTPNALSHCENRHFLSHRPPIKWDLKKFCATANAVSFFENRNFLLHRPPTKWELNFFCATANAVSSLENRVFLLHLPLCMTARKFFV